MGDDEGDPGEAAEVSGCLFDVGVDVADGLLDEDEADAWGGLGHALVEGGTGKEDDSRAGEVRVLLMCFFAESFKGGDDGVGLLAGDVAACFVDVGCYDHEYGVYASQAVGDEFLVRDVSRVGGDIFGGGDSGVECLEFGGGAGVDVEAVFRLGEEKSQDLGAGRACGA